MVKFFSFVLIFFLSFPSFSQAKEKNTQGAWVISEPLVAISPVPHSRVFLDVGLGGISLKSSTTGESSDKLTLFTSAFTLGYEYGNPYFGFNWRLPFGYISAHSPIIQSIPFLNESTDKSEFMIGDMSFRFRWKVLQKPKTGSFLSLGFELVLPSALLNTLGGDYKEIRARRMSHPMYSVSGGFGLLPIRYLTITPLIAFAQQIGKLTLGMDLLPSIIISSQGANRYYYTFVEFILSYDIYGVYRILKDRLLEAVLEVGGVSIITEAAGDDYNFPKVPGTTGITLTLGVKSHFAKYFEALLGLQYGLPIADPTKPAKDKRGYDLSVFFRHDWSLLFRIGVLL